jgi:hypothetical protein
MRRLEALLQVVTKRGVGLVVGGVGVALVLGTVWATIPGDESEPRTTLTLPNELTPREAALESVRGLAQKLRDKLLASENPQERESLRAQLRAVKRYVRLLQQQT